MQEIIEMKEQYKTVCNNYKRLYILALERILKEIGMFDVDVIRRADNRKGRLRIGHNSYDFTPFGADVVFYPYRKDGNLSAAPSGTIYVSNSFKEDLQRNYEVT